MLRYYILDPALCKSPSYGVANPQPLPSGAEPIEENPLKTLVRIDEISAQRGLGFAKTGARTEDSDQTGRKLSEQLRAYYFRHLDPSESVDPSDLEALRAIEASQAMFDARLADGFKAALEELSTLNYPSIADPKLKIATALKPIDGLNHNAAVQYEVSTGKTPGLSLPEDYNGLGFQNLISITFKLMSFRDGWMRVGKAQDSKGEDHLLPPVHLVLIEEPEAYLHPQVQQVFVRKAYAVLRKHGDLGSNTTLQTQLIVSTHSSHVAHECSFSDLRYFRRLPAKQDGVPTVSVINLSSVFGPNDETEKFVARYLRSNHCELLFADAAVFVEGAGERILLPHFIKSKFPELNRCYITILEVGGSHAHRLRPLIDHLGLTTLLVTDLDSVSDTGRHKSVSPKRNSKQLSGNATLKTWHPKKDTVDSLLAVPSADKILTSALPKFAVRVAYQVPITLSLDTSGTSKEALSTTFEDALVLSNIDVFKSLDGGDLATDVKAALDKHKTIEPLSEVFLMQSAKEKKPSSRWMFSSERIQEYSIFLRISTKVCNGWRVNLSAEKSLRILVRR